MKRDGMSLGLQLRRARRRAGLSLRDVAARTGGALSPGALSLIETGKRYPSLRTLETLARVLDLAITVSAEGLSTGEAQWQIQRRSGP
jgi:transcriptional regulator with XRE-family HTH domain